MSRFTNSINNQSGATTIENIKTLSKNKLNELNQIQQDKYKEKQLEMEKQNEEKRKQIDNDRREYYIKSDPEGSDIYAGICKCRAIHNSIVKFNDCFTKCNCHEKIANPPPKQLIICGDIGDSTLPFGVTGFNKVIEKNKIYNLRNLLNIQNDDNIIYILGNRCINKIKCLMLNKLNLVTESNSELNSLITKFNQGNITLNDYNTFYDNYTTNKISWKENMDLNWDKFWLNKDQQSFVYNIKKKSDDVINDKDNDVLAYFFTKRYYAIFTDSMGAPNILFSIIKELNYDDLIKEFNKIEKLNDKEHIDYKNILLDQMAFIVLSLFNGLLMKVDESKTYDISFNQKNLEIIKFQGLLYNVLIRQNTKFCHYLQFDNKEFLFSHGGLTKTLLDDPTKINILKEVLIYMKQIYLNHEKIKNFNENEIFTPKISLQSQLIDVEVEVDIKKLSIEDKIDYINKFIKEIMIRILDSDSNSNDEYIHIMILINYLLFMSADFACFNKTDKYSCSNNINTTLNSPILSGILNLYINNSEQVYHNNNSKMILYQVLGHKPYGFTTTIKTFKKSVENNSEVKTTFINMDTSITFSVEDYNRNSNSYLLITKAHTKVKSDIHFNCDKLKPINYSNNKVEKSEEVNIFNKDSKISGIVDVNIIDKYKHIFDPSNIDGTPKLYHNKNINPREKIILMDFNLDNIYNNYDKYSEFIQNNNLIHFHGYMEKNGIKYILFTQNKSIEPTVYQKNFFIISICEFKSLVNSLKIKQADNSFKNKYLKNKIKYLQISKNI